jgi:hypothetical protein
MIFSIRELHDNQENTIGKVKDYTSVKTGRNNQKNHSCPKAFFSSPPPTDHAPEKKCCMTPELMYNYI